MMTTCSAFPAGACALDFAARTRQQSRTRNTLCGMFRNRSIGCRLGRVGVQLRLKGANRAASNDRQFCTSGRTLAATKISMRVKPRGEYAARDRVRTGACEPCGIEPFLVFGAQSLGARY